jgi:catechol 2,3-dioxygenase-like lactoylglutathione lyase family enzyme
VFDHVTFRVADVDESRRFYRLALGEPTWEDGEALEWDDFSCGPGAPTRRAHLAFVTASPNLVDAFWRALTGEGFEDNGPPGPRPQYHEGYYGAFVLDPDGNNIEAVHHGWKIPHMIDHVFIRVADLTTARQFYETVLAPLGRDVWAEVDDRVGFGGRGSSLWVAEGEPTENLHIAFAAPDNATVDEFHRVALAAGFRDNGVPGERGYHPGYYGAFVLDPDGNNVEAVCHNR